MSFDRRIEVHSRPFRHAVDEEQEPEAPVEVASRERDLEAALLRLRSDEEKLVALLERLPRHLQATGRIVATRALGPRRAAALCGRAFGRDPHAERSAPARDDLRNSDERRALSASVRGREARLRSGSVAIALGGLATERAGGDAALVGGVLSSVDGATARGALAWLRSVPSETGRGTLFDRVDALTHGAARRAALSEGDLPAALARTFGPAARSVEIRRDQSVEAGAEAVTTQGRVHLAPGRFDLASEEGLIRLGHEVAHAIQQRRGQRSGEDHGLNASARGSLEREAERAGHAFAAGRPFAVRGQAPSLARLYRGGPTGAAGSSSANAGGSESTRRGDSSTVETGEDIDILARELRKAGREEATRRLRGTTGRERTKMESAVRRAFPRDADTIIADSKDSATAGATNSPGGNAGTSGGGKTRAGTPSDKSPDPRARELDRAVQESDRDPNTNGRTARGRNSDGDKHGAKGHKGGQPHHHRPHQGAGHVTPGAGNVPRIPPRGSATAPPVPQLDQLTGSDAELVDTEVADHQSWGTVGEAETLQRAEFVAGQAASGVFSVQTAEQLVLGIGIGAGMTAATKFVPIPGIGAMLGGAMAAYDLATRDWGATFSAIGKFGQGADIYEQIANSLAAIQMILELTCDALGIISGLIGVVAAVMWLLALVTGVSSAVAAVLSALATAIGVVAGVLELINTLVIKPAIVLFRAIHTYKSDADPADVEAQGSGIAEAASAAAGSLGQMAGGAATGAARDKPISAGPIKPVKPMVAEHAPAGSKNPMRGAWGDVKGTFRDAGTSIREAPGSAADRVRSMPQSARDTGHQIASAPGRAADHVKEQGGAAADWVKSRPDAVKSWWNEDTGGPKLFSQPGAWVGDKAHQAGNAVKSGASNLGNKGLDYVKNTPRRVLHDVTDPYATPPTGTGSDMQALMNQILGLQQQAEQAQQAETTASQEHAQSEAQRAPIQQAIAAGHQAQHSNQAHQQLTEHRAQSNQQQQQRQQQAQQHLSQYDSRATATTKVDQPMQQLSGYAWIGDLIPGDASSALSQINSDGKKSQKQMKDSGKSMGEHNQQQGQVKQGLHSEGQRIAHVRSQAKTSQQQLDVSLRGGHALQQRNEANVQAAAEDRARAQHQRSELEQQIADKTQRHNALARELRSWAAARRQKRVQAEGPDAIKPQPGAHSDEKAHHTPKGGAGHTEEH